MKKIRIVLVDDHVLVRAGLRALLENRAEFEIVGEASNATTGLDVARVLRPDVVVSDLTLPDLDGITLTRAIRSELPDVEVVLLTSVSDDGDWVIRALRAGAMGYLSTSANVDDLLEAIRSAASGRVVLSARATARVVQALGSPAATPLTDREREVLREIGIGRTNKQIARSLCIAETTVKSHVRVILDKLGVQSRTQAALHAVRWEIRAA
jgi:two-component system, NarL family, response regulator LiaR